jgi:hypothetical protein
MFSSALHQGTLNVQAVIVDPTGTSLKSALHALTGPTLVNAEKTAEIDMTELCPEQVLPVAVTV